MIYIITEGRYSDYGIQKLIEGPLGLDINKIEKEIDTIYRQLQAEREIKRREWEAKYPKEARSTIRSNWSEEARQIYPKYVMTGDVITMWLISHPEYHILEWDEINLYL